MDYFYSQVWVINCEFVVAPTINKAMELYQQIYPETPIKEVSAKAADGIWKNYDALVLKEE
jgi:hypothetical protein